MATKFDEKSKFFARNYTEWLKTKPKLHRETQKWAKNTQRSHKNELITKYIMFHVKHEKQMKNCVKSNK